MSSESVSYLSYELKSQAQADLQGALAAQVALGLGGSDRSRVALIQGIAGKLEVCVIGEVERLKPQAEVGALVERKDASQRQVQRQRSGTLQNVAAGIAECECAIGHNGKRVQVEPIRDRRIGQRTVG